MRGEPSAFEALPDIPIAKAIAAAAANGALVRAVDASDTLFVLVGHVDGRVDLNTRLDPDELAQLLRALADVVEAHGALQEPEPIDYEPPTWEAGHE